MSLDQQDFFARWQQLHIQLHHLGNDEDNKNDPGHTEKRADLVRNTIAQLQLARLAKWASPQCCNELFHQQTSSYGTIVDNPTIQNGLDNFADMVLAQTEGKPNESQSWSSQLTLEGVCEKGYMKDFLRTRPKQDEILPQPAQQFLPDVSNSSRSESVTKPLDTASVTRGQSSAPVPPVSVTRGQHMLPTDRASFSRVRSDPVPEVSESGRPQGFWNMPRADGAGLPRNKRPSNQPVKRQWDGGDDVLPSDEEPPHSTSAFRTAKQQLIIEEEKKNRGGSFSTSAYGSNKKSLGTRRGLNSKFVPPVLGREEDDNMEGDSLARRVTSAVLGGSAGSKSNQNEEIIDERLKNLDPKMVELIMNEIMDNGPQLTWEDIAGLEFAKKTIKEIVVWPMLRPDIFTGLRGPPKGLLLFGPPGTGKTLIGKCIASQSKSTFFSISASSLTSKWVGEGEKMVRALFGVARIHQPAVIFIDEIDSLLSQRTDGEHEASRRIKTEFLVQLDGATTGAEDRILVVGATNRPQEIDEAARRRFMKRLYIPLPEGAARHQIVVRLMNQQSHDLNATEHSAICTQTEGYSGSDMANLCREAALGPIRSMEMTDIENITAEQVRPILYKDFQDALTQVRASVSQKDLDVYLDWNKQYGSWGVPGVP